MKFAFSDKADRMVRPPSLSRDGRDHALLNARDARIYIRGQIFCGYPQFPTDTDRIRISDFKTHTDTDRIRISI